MSQSQRFDSQYEDPFQYPPAAEPIAADGQPDRPPLRPIEVGTKPVDTQDPRVATLTLLGGFPQPGRLRGPKNSRRRIERFG